MNYWFSVLFLSFTILFLNVFAYEEDEYYCQQNKDYKICRRCSDMDKPCPKEDWDKKCGCNHIAIFDPNIINIDSPEGDFKGDFKGGSNCDGEDDYGVPFCYIDEETKCNDSEISTFASEKNNLWYGNDDIYYSLEACENPPEKNVPGTGNEIDLENVKIEMDFLKDEVTGKQLVIKFPVPSMEDYDYEYQETEIAWKKCAEQCTERNNVTGICGAWSFNSLNGHCFLHTVDACCGQLDKQVKEDGYISGYVCPHCWSTRKKCPCTLDIRQNCATCSAHSSSGGTEIIQTTSAGILEVHATIVNIDVCECKRKYLRRKKQWGCVKPLCDITENGSGCTDNRRCRQPRKKQE